MAKGKNATVDNKEQVGKTGTEGLQAGAGNGVKPITPEERRLVKAATFTRVVTPRMNKALKAIRLVGQCSGTNYFYTETQAAKIVEALQVAVRQVADSYAKGTKKAPEFKLM